MAIYKLIKAINDKIDIVLRGITMLLLTGMTALIFAQVIFRYILKSPLSWSEALATYLFTLETFLGAAMVLRKNKHVRVTAVLNLIRSERVKRVVSVVTDLIILVLCLLLCVEGGQVIVRLLGIGQTSPAIPWLKTTWVYMFVPLSLGLMTLVKLEAILETLLHVEPSQSDSSTAADKGGDGV